MNNKFVFVEKWKIILMVSIPILIIAILIYCLTIPVDKVDKNFDISQQEAMSVEEIEEIKIYSNDILYGDVNLDGKVTADDAMIVSNYVSFSDGQLIDTIEKFTKADVNADGIITHEDAEYISNKVLDATFMFPAQEVKQKELKVREELKLEAMCVPATLEKVTWTSQNEQVASVDETGRVTAKGNGQTTITASLGGASKSCTISVTEILAENVYIYKESKTKGDVDYDGKVTENDAQLALQGVLYNNLDEEQKVRAEVDDNDALTANDAMLISARALDPNANIIFKTEEKVQNTAEDPMIVYSGDTIKLRRYIEPANTDNIDVTWQSSDEGVLSVDQNGLVTINYVPIDSTAKVTVTTNNNKTAECYFKVGGQKPSLSASVTGTRGTGMWYTSNVNINVNSRMPSGESQNNKIQKLYAKIEGKAYENGQISTYNGNNEVVNTIQVSKDQVLNNEIQFTNDQLENLNNYKLNITTSGTYTITITSQDNSGNETSVSYYINIDKNKPNNIKIENPSSGNWSKEPISLTLSVEEAESGILYYQYSYDGSNYETMMNSASNKFVTQPFEKKGESTLYIKAVDQAGNYSDVYSTQIKIDTELPIIEGVENDKIYNSPVTVKGADQPSGLNSSGIQWYYSESKIDKELTLEDMESSTSETNELIFAEDGYYCVVAVDNAGNASGFVYFRIDKLGENQITFKDEIWENGLASIEIETESEYTIEYQVNKVDGDWHTGTQVEDLNVGDIVYARLANGDEKGEYTTYTVTDNKKPVTPTIEVVSGNKIDTNTYTGEVVVKITQGKDNESGTKETIYTINGQNEQVITEDTEFTLAENGEYIIRAQTKDKAENLSNEAVLSITITEDNYFEADGYVVEPDRMYITRVMPNTPYEEFISHVHTNMEYYVKDVDDEHIKKGQEVVKTGDKVVANQKEYNVIVVGDINCDGMCNISDLSKYKRYIIEENKLSNLQLEAADVNHDKESNLTDLSQIVKYIIGMLEFNS